MIYTIGTGTQASPLLSAIMIMLLNFPSTWEAMMIISTLLAISNLLVILASTTWTLSQLWTMDLGIWVPLVIGCSQTLDPHIPNFQPIHWRKMMMQPVPQLLPLPQKPHPQRGKSAVTTPAAALLSHLDKNLGRVQGTPHRITSPRVIFGTNSLIFESRQST